MTSSATPTDRPPAQHEGPPSPPVQPVLIAVIGGAGLLLLGWLMILHKNNWHFTVAVFFMFVGWLAVLLTASFLWKAGFAAAVDESTMSHEEFWKPVGEREELEAEKKTLLKAIKEIEFDHKMGKMSDEDATQLTRYYRARAIEVIKALDGAVDGELSASERIARELEARLAIDKRTRVKQKSSTASADSRAGAGAGTKKKGKKGKRKGGGK